MIDILQTAIAIAFKIPNPAARHSFIVGFLAGAFDLPRAEQVVLELHAINPDIPPEYVGPEYDAELESFRRELSEHDKVMYDVLFGFPKHLN